MLFLWGDLEILYGNVGKFLQLNLIRISRIFKGVSCGRIFNYKELMDEN